MNGNVDVSINTRLVHNQHESGTKLVQNLNELVMKLS